jgi:hypothetical protein
MALARSISESTACTSMPFTAHAPASGRRPWQQKSRSRAWKMPEAARWVLARSASVVETA